MRTSPLRIIVVGSSGSGKSTLERRVRAFAATHREARIAVPRRVVTRAPRPDDENMRSVSVAEFQKLIAHDALGLYGRKYMEDGREEWYGFEAPPAELLPIYFANNGIVKNPELVRPAGFVENSRIVAVYAPDRVRAKRLKLRSPHLYTNPYARERMFRLSPEESSERIVSLAHATVMNYGPYEATAADDLIRLVLSFSTSGNLLCKAEVGAWG